MAGPPFAPEWLALVAGLKPALRLWRDAPRAAAEAHAATRRGFAVATTPLGTTAILYIARTPAAAARLAALERPILPSRELAALTEDACDRHRALGEALGFPACCVDAFVVRLRRGVDRLAGGDGPFHEDFVAAADAAARSARRHARLNMFPRDHGSTLLSHVPCRLDCAPSRGYADRLHAALRAHDPAMAASLDAALATPVAIGRDGRRLGLDEAPADACRLVFDIDLDPASGGSVP